LSSGREDLSIFQETAECGDQLPYLLGGHRPRGSTRLLSVSTAAALSAWTSRVHDAAKRWIGADF
jgi:hypothetical protein